MIPLSDKKQCGGYPNPGIEQARSIRKPSELNGLSERVSYVPHGGRWINPRYVAFVKYHRIQSNKFFLCDQSQGQEVEILRSEVIHHQLSGAQGRRKLKLGLSDPLTPGTVNTFISPKPLRGRGHQSFVVRVLLIYRLAWKNRTATKGQQHSVNPEQVAWGLSLVGNERKT